MGWSDIFRRQGEKPTYHPDPRFWPNLPIWSAGKNDTLATIYGKAAYSQWIVSAGELSVPSGDLVVCDPFVGMESTGNAFIRVPKGKHPVTVTLVDVSEGQDRSHVREAYASIYFQEGEEAYRKSIPLAVEDKDRKEPLEDDFTGFFVDAGTACFVDAWSIAHCMPDSLTWYEGLFENQDPDCWFKRMDDPNHIQAGIANITLPLARNGENIILFHSGWGDGVYPVVGSFDREGNLLAAHIDFFVTSPVPEKPEPSG
jgi:hypothetical protein